MKKIKGLFLGILASSFCLAGCYADLGFIKFGQKPESNNQNQNNAENNNQSINENNNNQNQNNNNQTENQNNNQNTGGNVVVGGTLLDTLKGIAKPIAAKVFSKSESSITFAEYEDEDAEADVYFMIVQHLHLLILKFIKNHLILQ